ncbi:MAG TPA: hypothetical protein VKM55_22260 [Candidatus Lokiarchaeia archaeon]|nr:hypothetical protein [Candidatus Lokiarchaeia archaeon]
MTQEEREVRCGIFGKWVQDDQGLPAIDYDCNEFEDDRAWQFTTSGKSNTQYHLLGNGSWLGIATNHGRVVVLDPRRGFTIIGASPGGNALDMGGLVTFVVRDQAGDACSDVNTKKTHLLAHRVFGAGYLEKKFNMSTISVTSRIMYPAGCEPVVIAECKIENLLDSEQSVDVGSDWNVYHLPLSKSLIVSWNKRRHYQKGSALNGVLKFAVGLQKIVKADTDGARRKHASRISFTVTKVSPSSVILTPTHAYARKRDPASPSDINYHYKPIIIACLDGEVSTTRIGKSEKNQDAIGDWIFEGTVPCEFKSRLPNRDARVVMVKKITLPGRATKSIRFMLSSCDMESLDALVAKYTIAGESESLLKSAASWFTSHAISFEVPGAPWLEREVTWHCIYVLSSMFKDEYRGLCRVPQASVYLLGHAFDGSIRDFTLFTYPLTFMNPSIAREYLKFIYTCIGADGKITYALHGFGKNLNVPGVHANPSDQYFFVTWITAEYIFLTRDFDFLNERVTIKDDHGKGKEFLVKDLLGRLITFVLSPAIGFGEHGMVHVRDGDWNDGITLLAKNRGTFIKRGESTFNSAMLLLSFAKAIPIVEGFDPELASRMRTTMTSVDDALDHAWNGKWYCRGYDGSGNALGNDTIFLDHHVWMLQNRSLPADKMNELLTSIENELVARSRCGAAIMHPPNPRSSILPPGWDINGGTWQALNSLLAWGIRTRAPEKALEFLQKMSMHNRAHEYPDTWYGQWSGPDSYNADDADRPGEAFFHASTPMCDFPFMNNNLHAGFLAAVTRYTGIEACVDRIKIDVSLDQPFTFRSSIVNIEKNNDRIVIEPGAAFEEDFLIEIVLPENVENNFEVEVQPVQELLPETEKNHVLVQWSRANSITKIIIKYF